VWVARAEKGGRAVEGHGASAREAWRCYPATIRFMWPFKANLVNVLKEVFPALAEKVRHMSDERFRRLHEQLTRRERGSA
jgi:hypothetical protein